MTDQAPASSRYVSIKLLRLANVPSQVAERTEISTEVTQWNRARTTVRMPHVSNRATWDMWWAEIHRALTLLPGADSNVPFAGVSQTFEVEWDGICRPI